MRKLIQEEFIEKAKQIHGELYDYTECIYVNQQKKVKIICKTHGMFEQIAHNHIHGRNGCWKCRRKRGGPSFQEFTLRAKQYHGDKYYYDETSFKNVSSSVTIICPSHGVFQQRGSDHLQGKGCRSCMGENNRKALMMTVDDFIQKATNNFNDFYDYSQVLYQGSKIPIFIKCKKHGVFEMTPNNHLRGHGCPVCAGGPISSVSQKWLDYLDVPSEFREAWVTIEDRKIKVDAFDPTTNTIFEFWGDFWHGNPGVFNSTDVNYRNKKSFGELYENTVERRRSIIEAGYNLIEIWENDFNERRF